jgi:hypothetical protein
LSTLRNNAANCPGPLIASSQRSAPSALTKPQPGIFLAQPLRRCLVLQRCSRSVLSLGP